MDAKQLKYLNKFADHTKIRTTNGFDYVCCEIFSQDAIVSVTLCELVEA